MRHLFRYFTLGWIPETVQPVLVCRWTFCLFFVFFLHPSLPGSRRKKHNSLCHLPSHLGWISEFHLWSCERHSCSLGSLIRIQTDGILLLSLVFPPNYVIYLFVLGAQGTRCWLKNTGQTENHMLWKDHFNVISIVAKVMRKS